MKNKPSKSRERHDFITYGGDHHSELPNNASSERRLQTLFALLAAGRIREDSLANMIASLAGNPDDIPFAVLYRLSSHTAYSLTDPATGIPNAFMPAACIGFSNLNSIPQPQDSLWAMSSGRKIDDISGIFSSEHRGISGRPTKSAYLAPLRRSSTDQPSGFLLLGISPQLSFDKDYQNFFEAISDAITVNLTSEKKRLELQAAEQSLGQSKEQLSLALKTSRTGFFNWDIQRQALHFNEQMCADWGVSPGTFKRATGASYELIHPEDRERIKTAIQIAIQTAKPYWEEYRIVRADGSIIWIEARGEVSYDAEGRPSRFFGTSLDVTERRAAREELERAKAHAEAANATKSAFLANMSHEIRTPLGIILGYTEFLLDPEQSANDHIKSVNTIRRHASHLSNLVNDLLDLSKIEAERLEIDDQVFELVPFVQDITDAFAIKANEKGVKLKVDFAKHLPSRVRSDSLRLKQILVNVIGNAIKFTDKGTVAIHVSLTPAQNKMPSQLVFVIADSGIGLSAEQQQKIWEPFVQADNTVTRRFGGTGLGLTLARQLARALGGDLVLNASKPGSGSVFTATVAVGLPSSPSTGRTLPFDLPKRSSIKADVTPPADKLTGLKILVVDDSPDNQLLISRFLSRSGAQVQIASDGLEGIHKVEVESGNFDLILMDMQMPRLDGLSAMQSLRHKGHSLPIVALTANAMKGERERSLEAGFDDHLTKPIDWKALVDKVAKLVGRC